jgi:hypothetical protein
MLFYQFVYLFISFCYFNNSCAPYEKATFGNALYVGFSPLRLIAHWLTWVIKTQNTMEAFITLDGVTLTDPLVRWSPNEWPSVCLEILVSTDKMFWTSNKPAKLTPYIFFIFTSRLPFWVIIYNSLRHHSIVMSGTDCWYASYCFHGDHIFSSGCRVIPNLFHAPLHC